MYDKKRLGWGFKVNYNPLYLLSISIFNEKNQRIASLSPTTILQDASTFARLKRPSLKQWFLGLFDPDKGYTQDYLRRQGRKIYKYRYYVKIGCTEFTYGQLYKIISYAEKHKA